VDLVAFFEKRSRLFWGIGGLVCIILLGLIDYITGLEVNISFFYLTPIALLAWYAGGDFGLFAAAASSIAWFIADFANGQVYSHPVINVWNVLLRLGFFVVVSWLIATLRKSYKQNEDLARVDFVTGATSARYFYELARIELGRSERYGRPFTLVYLDVDDFKGINDHLGHSAGDRVLRAVAASVLEHIRPSDTFGRLGGDEFALLLPETDQAQAKKVVDRIHASLVDEMRTHAWKVSFSVGVVSFTQPPKSVDEMVHLADGAMYQVKTHGKNGVMYQQYGN
jgi:diguanylate cyclase (GGDEF)-like protein